MLVDRVAAVVCFSFLFITTATDVEAKPTPTGSGYHEQAELRHHGDKPWDATDVSCGK